MFYLSQQALESKWVRKEHALALKHKKTAYYILDKEETRKLLRKWKSFRGSTMRIPIINDDAYWLPLTELISTIISKYYTCLYPNVDIDSLLATTSKREIVRIQQGRFTKVDDDGLSKLIEEANTIKILMLNAYNFLDRFKEPLQQFFTKKDVKLYLLLADESSVFYNENSILVNPSLHNNKDN